MYTLPLSVPVAAVSGDTGTMPFFAFHADHNNINIVVDIIDGMSNKGCQQGAILPFVIDGSCADEQPTGTSLRRIQGKKHT